MRTLFMILCFALRAAPAHAQLEDEVAIDSNVARHWRAGIAVGAMIPGGEFAHQSKPGWFVDGFVTRRALVTENLGVRLDFTAAQFSSDAHQTTLRSPGFGDVPAKLAREDDIFALTIGPEWTKRSGSVRPFVRAGVGAAIVIADVTLSVKDPTDNTDKVVSEHTVKQSSAFAYAVAAGVDFRILHTLVLDIGLGMHATGPVTYYGHGRLPDGSETSLAGPFHSPTRVYALTVGVLW